MAVRSVATESIEVAVVGSVAAVGSMTVVGSIAAVGSIVLEPFVTPSEVVGAIASESGFSLL